MTDPEADTRGVEALSDEPTVWGWWHDEPGICNHLADYCGATCGRKSGEWKPLVKKSDFDAEVAKRREAELDVHRVMDRLAEEARVTGRLRAALERLLKSRDTDLPDHQPIDQDGAIVCAQCGDWWKDCPVNLAAAALDREGEW